MARKVRLHNGVEKSFHRYATRPGGDGTIYLFYDEAGWVVEVANEKDVKEIVRDNET